MKSFKQHLTEGSHDFKDFKDPWAVMSPEDRKEANRLTILIMKVMAGSPRQKELQAKRNAILAKYKIGQRKESITEAASGKMKWKPYRMKTVDGKIADWIEMGIESDNNRFLITKRRGSSTFKVFDRRHPKTNLSFSSLEDAKDEAEWALRNDPRTEWHPSLRENITEANKQVKWMRPKIATLKQEYEIEYKKHLVHELDKDVFPTVESFLKAAKEGIVRTITKGHDYYIRNRSHTKSMKQLLSLIKTYRSYPKYRNETTLRAMEDAMLSGQPMDMPIIVRETAGKNATNLEIKEIASGKRDRIFSGNTRMDIAFMNGIMPKALIVFLPQGAKL